MKIKFKKDNKIIYGQDFHCSRGIPSDIEFTVEKFTNDKIILKAKGYGDLESGNYGNGSLSVCVNDLPKKLVSKLIENGIISKELEALEKLVDYQYEWMSLKTNSEWNDTIKSKLKKQMLEFVDNYL